MQEIKQRLQSSNSNTWLSIIDELEVEAERIEDRTEKSRRLYALGQACEELFLRKDRAMVNYQKAFKLLPQDARPLVRARQIYREMGNLKMVAKLMDFQLKVVLEPKERARLLTDLALVFIDLRQPEDARIRLNEAHALDPDAPALEEALATVDPQAASWSEAVETLAQEAESLLVAGSSVQSGDRGAIRAADLLVRAARICNVNEPDSEQIESLLSKAVTADPQHESANDLLENLLFAQGRTDEIRRLHERRLEQAPEEDHARLLRSFASLWTIRFSDRPVTAAFYDRALRTYYTNGSEPFPGHLAAFAVLREVGGVEGNLEALLELADQGLNAPLLEDDLLVLAIEAGEIAWKGLGSAERAAHYFDWARKINPEHPALKAFSKEHEDLLQAAEAEESAQDKAQPEGDVQAAEAEESAQDRAQPEGHVAEDRDEHASATATAAEEDTAYTAEEPTRIPHDGYSAYEAERPTRVVVGDEMEQLASASALSEAEQETQAQQAEVGTAEKSSEPAWPPASADAVPEAAVDVPAATQAEAAAEPAAVSPQPLATSAAPLDIEEEVDEAAAALFAEAAAAEQQSAERGINAWRKAAQKARNYRTPRRALARLYTDAERWNPLVEVLKEEVELVEAPADKRALLLQVAGIYRDRLNLDVMMVNVLNQALKTYEQQDAGEDLDQRLAIIDQLLLQYEKMKRWTDLIAKLKEKAALLPSEPDKVEIWSQVASLFIERFSNQAEAIKAYEEVLKLDPTHAAALRELKAMYERRRDWDKLIDVWQREIDGMAGDNERAAAYIELAQLASRKLKRPQISTDLWNRVLDFDPNNLEALQQLETLYERSKAWGELADVCQRQVELSDDTTRKVALLQKLGILYSDKVEHEQRAIEAWRELLEVEPDNRRAQDSLKKLYLAAKAYDELEDFYGKQDRWDEFIRVLERQVDAEAGESKIRLYFKIADLWQRRLEKPDRAVRAYEKVLSLDEENLEAAEALIPLYQGGRDVRKYARALEVRLKHTDDQDAKLERIREVAQLYEEQLRDKSTAFDWTLRALSVDPGAEWVREQAERLAAEVDRWPELVSAYEAAQDHITNPMDQLPLLLTVARVYEQELANADEGLRVCKRILEVDPQNAQALDSLERLYVRTQQWSELLDVYQRKIELVEDTDERKEVYFNIARIYQQELGEAERAIDTYRTILDLAGDDGRALHQLNDIYQQQERWEELAETLMRELTIISVDDVSTTIELKYRLGQLDEQQLGDISAAIECYRDILELERGHEGARSALESRLSSEGHQLEVVAILEPIYTELEEWHKLVQVLEIKLSREEDVPTKVELLLRIGALWVERIGDGDKAFDAYSRCFSADPGNETARGELERLADIQDRLEDLSLLYEDATREALDAPLQHQLFLKLASIMYERLDKEDQAIEFYRKAQDLEPDHLPTLDALEKLYNKREEWPQLLEVYGRKAELSVDVEERKRLFRLMARIYEDMLGNLAQAATCYNEILAQDATNRDALKALDRLYQVQGQWHELADNLSRQLALTEQSEEEHETIDILVRLASLRQTELAEAAAAVDTYRQVLERDPRNAAAVNSLEALIQEEEHQLSVAQLLQPYYKATNDWRKLVDTYEIMVMHAYEPNRKIELLHDIAELYEVAGEDSKGAFEVYGRALKESPAHEPTQQSLERLARELESWEALVGLYSTVVADVMDEGLAVALHMKIAGVYEHQINDLDEAAASYNRILEIDPQNMEAVEALEQIYMRGESNQKLVEVLLKKAEIVLDAPERKSLLFRAAQIHEEVLEAPREAVRVYQMVLELDDADEQAIDALERLYTRLERWDDLKDTLSRKVELAQTAGEKKEIYFRLGSLYEQQLEDLDRAIETFHGVLDLDTEDTNAIEALGRLYRNAERWYDLLQILERQVELAQGSPRAVDLKYSIGKLWEGELTDLPRAIETYRDVLTLDAMHEATLNALDAIVHGDSEPVLAAQVLEPIHEQSLEWAKLIDIYEVMVQHLDDPYRKLELLHKIADLREQKLDDSAGAFEAHGRALQEDSADEVALVNLERLAGDIRGWDKLAELYESQLDKLLDPTQQAEMGLRVARVYEEELSQLDQAIVHLNKVLEADYDNRRAIEALDRLYEQTEQYERLTEILRREVQMAEDESAIIALHFRLGQLYQEQLKDLGNAIDCYREILATTPDHTQSVTSLELLFEEGHQQLEIAEILEPLYRASEEWQKLVRILEVQLERTEDELDKIPAAQRISEICEQRLGDHDRAFRWYAYALRCDPTAEPVTDELERLARIVDGWENLVGVYNEVLQKLAADDRKRLHRMAARICEEELGDRTRAEESYLRVLEIDAEDESALEALDRLYEQSSMFAELAEILKRRIAITDSTEQLVQLQLRLGTLYETPLDDLDSAVSAYVKALEADSRNAAALDALEKIYFSREQWAELYDIYEKRIDIALGDSGVADCYARMAKLSSDALGDSDRAQDLWNRVLDLRGEDAVALWALADLYEAAEQWRDLVEVLERQATIVDEVEPQVRLYERLGRIWGEKLDRERNALENWQRVLDLDPNHLAALYAIAAIYRNTQAWEELVETLHRLLDIGLTLDMSNDELKSLYAQLGELQGEILLRPQEAIDAWRKVLDYQSDDFRALGALETLLTQEARWEECIQVLERKTSALDDPVAKIDVLMQVASIWQDKLDDDRSAAGAYERILELDTGHEMAFVSLERIYTEDDEWDKLVELLVARVELVDDVAQSVDLLQRVAKIYEQHLGQPQQAFEVLRVAFKDDYGNDVTVRELERLASITNSWNDLFAEAQTVVQTVQEPKVKADLLVNMGLWYSELGHLLDGAIPHVQQALQIDPESRRALDALAGFFRKSGHWAELVQVLNRSQELEDDPGKRVEILCAMGEIQEDQLNDPEQAIGSYRKALALDDANAEVLNALQRLYGAVEQWDGLIGVLVRKVELTEEPEDVMRLRTQIGELYEERTNDLPRAIEAYKDILMMEPQNLPALKALERLYEKSGQTEDYLDVLEQQLDVAGSDNERVSLYQRMAGVWEEQFGKLDRAAECLEKVLDVNDTSKQTYVNLQRLYRADNRHEDLVETIRRHINAISDPHDRIDLYLAMGQVYDESLNDPDRAIEAYNDILSFDADHTKALDALARLYEQIESWNRAADVMRQLVELVDDVTYRVDVLFRLGRIHEEHLRDVEAAEEYYTRALELDGTHLASMLRLVALYRGRDDYAKAGQMMVQAEAFTTNQLEKTRLLYEAGNLYLDKLGDEATATDLFARTLAIDPDHVGAGEPLAEIYFRDERYNEVEPVLEMLVRKTDRRNHKRLQELYYRLARTADVLQKNDKALKYYRAAYDIDSTDLPTLRGMADLLHRMEDWDRAFKIYQTILVHHRDSQQPSEIVQIFYRLGNIKLRLGERKKALNMFEKALEHDAYHRETLEAIVDLQARHNAWDAVVNAKRALLERADTQEQYTLYLEIGEIYREQLKVAEKAIAAFREALALQPDSHEVLHRLVELYSATKQWKRAVEVVLRLAEVDESSRVKARYYYTAAVIMRDEIRSLDEALDLFDRSLDHTFEEVTAATELKPEQFKAFEALDRICTQKKDWKAQERYYRKMIKRLPAEGQAPWKVRLWHALGEIYRTRLRDLGSAMAAFEVAAQLEPVNVQRHEILAELYVMSGPDYLDKAIGAHQTLIAASPFKIDSYKALRQIYMDTKQYDKAWCVCAALSFLKKSDDEEQRFFEQYRQRGFVRARARLTDDLWRKHVFHESDDVYIGTIFGVLSPAVSSVFARPHKAYGLKKKERRDLDDDKLLLSNVFKYVTSLLNVMLADLFVSQKSAGMQMAHTVERPSFVVGNDLLTGRPEKELAFVIGKQLSFLRPEHFVVPVRQHTVAQLRAVFFAGMRLCNPNFPIPPADVAAVDEVHRALAKEVHKRYPGLIEQLAGVVKAFVERRGEANLARWMSATQLTANRAGLICANDLEVAAKMVSTEPTSMGALPAKERVKELVLYSVSESYFRVRADLGLTIQQ